MNSKIIKVFLGVLVFGLLVVPVTFAKIQSYTPQTYDLPEDAVVDDDVLAAADTVTIAGTVNGDVYVAGERVTVSGTVNGDVYAVGGVVEISGSVRDDVVTAAGTVTVRNVQIGDSLATAGGTISISDDVEIAGGQLFAGGTIVHSAKVGRGMYGAAGSLDFNGSVAKNTWLYLGMFSAGENASISGDLSYSMEKETDLPEALTVGGATSYVDPSMYTKDWNDYRAEDFSGKVNFGFHLWSFSAALLIGFLFLYLFYDVAKNTALTIKDKLPQSLGWGLLVLFGTIPVVLLLCMTVVGIPLGLLLMGAFFLEMYFAKIFIGVLYGMLLKNSFMKNASPNKYVLFTLGLGVYYVICLIPFINVLQMLGGILLTLGALFIVKRDRFIYRVHE